MGTGLFAPFYRAGCKVFDEVAWRWIGGSGVMRSSARLSPRAKKMMEVRYAMEERAQIAMAVASMYPGGDYFEFGSAGFRTLRNFLTAFDLNDRAIESPDTRFFAFDVFGAVDSGQGIPSGEEWFYEHYRGDKVYVKDHRELQNHGLLLDRCEIIPGYFEDSLNEAFKERLRREKRSIGFAFIDCNISSSYQTCFNFLEEFVNSGRAFIYMDEYFITLDVPAMFETFCKNIRQRHGLTAHYVRNAGSFGALFCLMHE